MFKDVKFAQTFWTDIDHYKCYIGQTFEVIGKVTKNANHEIELWNVIMEDGVNLWVFAYEIIEEMQDKYKVSEQNETAQYV